MRTKFDLSFDPPAPIATVVIRNHETGERSDDIEMLLDTGADVSLLPSRTVEAMGLPMSEDFKLDLVGFDGAKQSLPMVKTQIVFAEKRCSGNYCVIDDKLGILGRDVLNQLTIVLDGPELEWEARVSSELDTAQ